MTAETATFLVYPYIHIHIKKYNDEPRSLDYIRLYMEERAITIRDFVTLFLYLLHMPA